MSTTLTPQTLEQTTPAVGDGSQAVVPFENRLDQNPTGALAEGRIRLEGKGTVQQAMRRITQRLEDIGVPYAIVGGIARPKAERCRRLGTLGQESRPSRYVATSRVQMTFGPMRPN